MTLLNGFITRDPTVGATILNKNNYHSVFDYYS